MLKSRVRIIPFIILFAACTNSFCSEGQLQECLDFYQKIYQIMSKEYYKEVSKEEFEKFIEETKSVFDESVTWQPGALDNFKYSGAAFLVNRLKDPQDDYSCFRSLEKARDFASALLKYEQGLGIEGSLINMGFKVTWVEPRSDAFQQGLRQNDIIIRINSEPVKGLSNEQVIERLHPVLGAQVALGIISGKNRQKKSLVITCREFFRKTSFLSETSQPGIFCLKIRYINQKILEDLDEIFASLQNRAVSGLILDFRDNDGGIIVDTIDTLAGYFIPPGNRLCYMSRRSQKLAEFFSKPAHYNYSGPLLALMNKNTGSAPELLLGALRTYGRVILAGQNSAGSGKTKSFIAGEDGAWNIYLIVALNYLPDGSTFDNEGLKPDYEIPDDEQALSSVVDILIKHGQNPRN